MPMEVRDSITPQPPESCSAQNTAQMLKEYRVPPSHLVEDEGRLVQQLRDIVNQHKNDAVKMLRIAVEVLFWSDPSTASIAPEQLKSFFSHPQDFARAIADLSVSGKEAFTNFCRQKPTPRQLINEVTLRVQDYCQKNNLSVPDMSPLNNVVHSLLHRAYDVAWALRKQRRRQSYLVANIGSRVDSLGWIAVSGEDDPPHRPVNVPTTPYPQFDLDVVVQSQVVQTRFIIASESSLLTKPIEEPQELGFTCPTDDFPSIDPDEEIIFYIHGHSSRLEECLDLAPHLWKPFGSKSCKKYCVIAMDLPSCGYASMIDWQSLVGLGQEESDCILQFIEEFIINFIDKLTETVRSGEVNLKQRLAAIIGGSLGGNMGLRLGQRTNPFWIHNIVSWSPASVWDAFKDDLFKSGAAHTVRDRAKEEEEARSRKDYFYWSLEDSIKVSKFVNGLPIDVEIVPPQPEMWYRNNWQPCKDDHIYATRLGRQEIYNREFRRWHWRVAFEQLRFSHKDPQDYPRFLSLKSNTFLVAGENDNYNFVNIYDATRWLALHMVNTQGKALFLKDTGHSIHNERPAFLAHEIHEFLPPLPDSWGNWQSLGGELKTAPTIGRNLDGRLEVFALGAKDHIWHTWQTGSASWTNNKWEELHQNLDSQITFTGRMIASQNKHGVIEFFVIDTTGALYHIWQKAPNSSWGDWASSLSGNPNAGSEHYCIDGLGADIKDNKLEVVVFRDIKSNIQIRGQTDLGGWWDSWADKLPPKAFVGRPVIVKNQNGTLEIFACDANGTIFHVWETRHYSDTFIQQWQSLSGSIIPGSFTVYLSSREDKGREPRAGCLVAFACSLKGELVFCHQLNPNGFGGWSGWKSLGGKLKLGTTPAVTTSALWGALMIFVRDKDDSISYIRQTPEQESNEWAPWRNLSGVVANSDPVVDLNSNSSVEVFVVGSNDELWFVSQQAC